MSRGRRAAALAGAVLALSAAPGALGQIEDLDAAVAPMSDMFLHLARYRALAPHARELFDLHYCLSADDVPAGEVRLDYAGEEGARVAIALDARGCVVELPDAETLARDPLVVSDQRRGAIEMTVHVRPVAELSRRMDAQALRAAAAAATAATRQSAGVLGLVLPHFHGVAFEFDGPAPMLAHAVLADGTRFELEIDYDRAYYRPNTDRRLARAATLEFGETPMRASLIP